MASEAALSPPAPVENLTLWQRVYDHLRAEILGREARARRRARRGRARRAAGRQPRADPGGDRTAGIRRPRHRPAAPRRRGQLALEGRVPRALPGARGAGADGGQARGPKLQREDIAALEELIDEMATQAERDGSPSSSRRTRRSTRGWWMCRATPGSVKRYRQLLDQLGRYRTVVAAAREPPALRRRARRHPPGGQARRRRPGLAPHVRAHPGAADAGSRA